MKSNGKIKGVY